MPGARNRGAWTYTDSSSRTTNHTAATDAAATTDFVISTFQAWRWQCLWNEAGGDAGGIERGGGADQIGQEGQWAWRNAEAGDRCWRIAHFECGHLEHSSSDGSSLSAVSSCLPSF